MRDAAIDHMDSVPRAHDQRATIRVTLPATQAANTPGRVTISTVAKCSARQCVAGAGAVPSARRGYETSLRVRVEKPLANARQDAPQMNKS